MARAKSSSSMWIQMAVALAIIAVVVVGVGWSEQRRIDTIDRTDEALHQAFMRMPLPQALARCRELNRRAHADPSPVALAWQPGRLDWYELRGVDRRTMRRFSCDGVEVRQGPRVARALLDRVPESGPAAAGGPHLLELAARQSAVDLQGFEVALDPQPGADPAWIERRWVAGQAQSAHPLAERLPRLFATQPLGLPAAPLLPPARAHDWLKEPQAAFSLLDEHVPRDSRVVLLELASTKLAVVVTGRMPRNADRPPALFGEADFDESGVRGNSEWQPSDQVTGGCGHGRTLAEVRDAFLAAAPRMHPGTHLARFGCGRRSEPGGEWFFFSPRGRR